MSSPSTDSRPTLTTTTTATAAAGRRVFVKSDDVAPVISKKISMAALPDAHNGFPVRVFAKRHAAVNTAVKAVAIATSRLVEKGVPIVCIPSFRDNRNEVSLYICPLLDLIQSTNKNNGADDDDPMDTEQEQKKQSNYPNVDADKMVHFNISSKTDIRIAAGAIANSARSADTTSNTSASAIGLQAIGQDAVFHAIRAVAVAREYLSDKKDDMDLFCKIEFTQVQLTGRSDETTAVKFTCYIQPGNKFMELTMGENNSNNNNNNKRKKKKRTTTTSNNNNTTNNGDDDDDDDNDDGDDDEDDDQAMVTTESKLSTALSTSRGTKKNTKGATSSGEE